MREDRVSFDSMDRRRARLAIVWLALFVPVCCAYLLAILRWVPPHFADIYDDLGADLPSLTRWAIAISGAWPLVVLGGIALEIWIVRLGKLARREPVRLQIRASFLTAGASLLLLTFTVSMALAFWLPFMGMCGTLG